MRTRKIRRKRRRDISTAWHLAAPLELTYSEVVGELDPGMLDWAPVADSMLDEVA